MSPDIAWRRPDWRGLWHQALLLAFGGSAIAQTGLLGGQGRGWTALIFAIAALYTGLRWAGISPRPKNMLRFSVLTYFIAIFGIQAVLYLGFLPGMAFDGTTVAAMAVVVALLAIALYFQVRRCRKEMGEHYAESWRVED